ncbi:MAG TPA: M14 family zinc carboxypeptidase [Vicinamibacterales bacterium]|nr:M14 family zinc carboxypeptidase [Vicinamibacterales bacterium]
MKAFPRPRAFVLGLALALVCGSSAASAQQAPAGRQKQDEAYSKRVREITADPRVITELVDHLPASDAVPSPLKFFGRVIGEPGHVNYYKDIVRYLEAVDKASERVSLWTIGKSDEGRDMVALAIADEATIRSLEKYKQITAQLTDPRKVSEAQARELIRTGKPIYYATGSIHSPEMGSPEMLMELTYRLAVEETPFIQAIRNNSIVMITPATEVDGRDKQVDTFWYQKKTGKNPPPLVYWGNYVAHDNNRDAMGVSLNLTKNMLRTFLTWHPTVWHDLHESVSYLYTSTGTGPYNGSLDPIVVDEWWLLAKTETSEMTKRGVPGVWTYGFYDGWVPNYLFFIANMHNSIGRFYETQSYRGENYDLNLPAATTSREWYRANPPLSSIKWGPRNNVNMQQSALLIAMNYVARNREQFLENYYLKNKRAVEKGRNGAPYAWVIPAAQRRKVEAAELVNLLRLQGVEVHAAPGAFSAGDVQVNAGDYVVRMDQPYRTVVDMLLDVQNYPAANPRPYDDTGWSFPLLRNVKAAKVADKAILDQPMTLLAQDVSVPGTTSGSGDTLIVEHNTDNTLVTFRFANRDVKMLAAEEEFEAAGRKFVAGAFIVPNADRGKLEASIKELGLTAYAVAGVPTVKTHELDVPRIGYVHSWARTQDEGWVRLAFDRFKVPYTYFADQKLREGNLRAKYDVIVMPHIGGDAQQQVNGLPMIGDPIPYKKSELTPNLGVQDSSDDIRGGMGLQGLMNLAQFVQEGGTLIVEGSTSTIFPAYGLTAGVSVEEPPGLFVRGSVLKAMFADRRSPIAYGYDSNVLPVYFNQAPVLRVGGGFGRGFGGRGGPEIPGVGQNLTPNAVMPPLAELEPSAGEERRQPQRPMEDEAAELRQMARAFGFTIDERVPRVVLRFPTDPGDMLLSGVLAGGQALAGRAAVLDAPVGKGHVVMFATRPYWRWETQGSFFLGFNAILNWNDLDAGRPAERRTTTMQ